MKFLFTILLSIQLTPNYDLQFLFSRIVLLGILCFHHTFKRTKHIY